MTELRIIATSGVHLDRAWPELGHVVGIERRRLAESAFSNLVATARERGADALLFLGDLFDGRAVSLATIRMVCDVFDAFSGRVLIVPGSMGPLDPASPYLTTEWPERVSVFTSRALSPVTVRPGFTFWGRASRSTGQDQRAGAACGDDEGSHIVLSTEVDQAGAAYADRGALSPDLWILGGAVADVSRADLTRSGCLVSSSIHGPHASQAVCLDLLREGGVARKSILDVGPVPSESQVLDVSALSTTEELRRAVEQLDAAKPIRLSGQLRRGVLLPGIDEHDSIRVDRSGLTFDLREPDPGDQLSAAEFERFVLAEDRTDYERHQAIALGLHALEQASGPHTSGASR